MRQATWQKVFMAVTLALAPALIYPQQFPTKPVRLVVGFPAAAGIADIAARFIANKLNALWGVPVLVDNRPGAGSNIAAEFVARAPADGYTLLWCTVASHGISPAVYRSLPFDPVKDFTPISQIATLSNVFVVNSSSPLTTLPLLIGYAKSNPGKLSVASGGIGTAQHLSLEIFMSMTGTSMVYVPYKGSGPALTDLLGGQVPTAVLSLPTALPMIKAGKLRALGVSTAKRSPQLPEAPTFAEAGVAGYDVSSWNGLCGPAGLPGPVVAKINTDLVALLNTQDVLRRLAEQGLDVAPSTPEQLAALIKTDVVKWAKAANAAGVKPE